MIYIRRTTARTYPWNDADAEMNPQMLRHKHARAPRTAERRRHIHACPMHVHTKIRSTFAHTDGANWHHSDQPRKLLHEQAEQRVRGIEA
eukprot:6197954-Pleurochrysis_carterae.AAC.2